MLSNKWITANEIYKPTVGFRDLSKMIYKDTNGSWRRLEARPYNNGI